MGPPHPYHRFSKTVFVFFFFFLGFSSEIKYIMRNFALSVIHEVS